MLWLLFPRLSVIGAEPVPRCVHILLLPPEHLCMADTSQVPWMNDQTVSPYHECLHLTSAWSLVTTPAYNFNVGQLATRYLHNRLRQTHLAETARIPQNRGNGSFIGLPMIEIHYTLQIASTTGGMKWMDSIRAVRPFEGDGWLHTPTSASFGASSTRTCLHSR